MAIDTSLELFDAAVDNAANTNVSGNWINLGKVGLPQGTQFIVGVDNPGGVAGDTPITIEFVLEMTLDNNAHRHAVTSFKIDALAAYEGVLVRDISEDFNVQEYAAANVDVRFTMVPISNNASNNVTADRVYAFLGSGEKQCFGRAGNADTLYVHP